MRVPHKQRAKLSVRWTALCKVRQNTPSPCKSRVATLWPLHDHVTSRPQPSRVTPDAIPFSHWVKVGSLSFPFLMLFKETSFSPFLRFLCYSIFNRQRHLQNFYFFLHFCPHYHLSRSFPRQQGLIACVLIFSSLWHCSLFHLYVYNISSVTWVYVAHHSSLDVEVPETYLLKWLFHAAFEALV